MPRKYANNPPPLVQDYSYRCAVCGGHGFVIENSTGRILCRKCLCARDGREYLPDEGESKEP